jgi:hypothetical protein
MPTARITVVSPSSEYGAGAFRFVLSAVDGPHQGQQLTEIHVPVAAASPGTESRPIPVEAARARSELEEYAHQNGYDHVIS